MSYPRPNLQLPHLLPQKALIGQVVFEGLQMNGRFSEGIQDGSVRFPLQLSVLCTRLQTGTSLFWQGLYIWVRFMSVLIGPRSRGSRGSEVAKRNVFTPCQHAQTHTHTHEHTHSHTHRRQECVVVIVVELLSSQHALHTDKT